VGGRGISAFAVVVLLMAALVAYAVWLRPSRPLYALDVDGVFEHPEKVAGGDTIRVEGLLVPGSCVRYESPCEWRFQIHGRDHVLNVRYRRCEMPTTAELDPDVKVVLEGFLAIDRTEVVAERIGERGDVEPALPEERRPICPGPHVR
jgi:cytochrome c-type biogenesis protein CcmE